jgi:hypothetical protein
LDENFSRLITTFDEVPRLPMSAERTPRFASCARLPLSRQGVDLKRRPPKSLPAPPFSKIALRSRRCPQGLRRPRFSFFRFTYQTARDQGDPTPWKTREPSKPKGLRLGSEAWSPSISEELRRRAVAPRRRRAEGRYIGAQPGLCQHPGAEKTALAVQSGNSNLLK